MPKITIITPVYNMEQYLVQFLDSIRQQTFQDFEIILVDDGSSDNSPAILDHYAENESRAKVFHKENGGVSSARNVGLDHATGEYVYIVDSDDWLEPTALEVLWKEAERTGADIIYGMTFNEGAKGSILRRVFPNPFVTQNSKTISEIQCALLNNHRIQCDCEEFKVINSLGGVPWRGILRRAIIEEHCIRYNEKLRQLGEDYLFWQYVFEHVKSIAYIESPIYHYRDAEQSLSHGFKENLLDVYREVFVEEERFLREKKKAKEHFEAYYFRVILYIRQAMGYYFINEKNPKSEKELFIEFKRLLHAEPYFSAVRKVHLRKLMSPKSRREVVFLRFGLLKHYWKLFRSTQ